MSRQDEDGLAMVMMCFWLLVAMVAALIGCVATLVSWWMEYRRELRELREVRRKRRALGLPDVDKDAKGSR